MVYCHVLENGTYLYYQIFEEGNQADALLKKYERQPSRCTSQDQIVEHYNYLLMFLLALINNRNFSATEVRLLLDN